MARIFFSLALIAVLLVVANLGLGLWVGDFNGSARTLVAANRQLQDLESRGGEGEALRQARQALSAATQDFAPIRQRATLHKLLGIGAALVAILVNCISVTYFVGTSRWCREVVEQYGLDPDIVRESARLKRRSFPWSVSGALAIVAIVALGGASDPGSNLTHSARWVMPHQLAAYAGVAFLLWAYSRQWGFINENLAVIDRIMAGVAARRGEQPEHAQQSEN